MTNPEPGLHLRVAEPGDAEAMRALIRAAYAVYIERIGREPAPMTADYEQLAASGRALLAWQDGQLVGVLVTDLEEEALLVENVAVLPSVQGIGLGAVLLHEAEHLARTRARTAVRLYTNEAMTENIDYYRRHGFTETHRATEDGFRRVHFEKQLRP